MSDKQKGKKLKRIGPASKAYYKLQFGRTDTNRKRKMRRHIRNHPNDAFAHGSFEDHGFGKSTNIKSPAGEMYKPRRFARMLSLQLRRV